MSAKTDLPLAAAQAETSTRAALELVEVHKRFGPQRDVLAGISMRLEAGERVALLGESGVGKSTLLNLIAGLERADAGEIWLDGQAMHTLSDERAAAIRARDIGFVFQAFHLLAHLRLWQNVAIPMLLGACAIGPARAAAESMLDRVGLGARVNALPRELSGGEQQRVALARALAAEPQLLLADEPTGNLDGETGQQVIRLMFELTRRIGSTMVLITHDTALAERCDRVVRMLDGRIQPEVAGDRRVRAAGA